MINYIVVDDALSKHDEIIEKSGGLIGIRNIGDIESVLEFMKDDGFYSEFIDKLAYLMHTVNKKHTFVDGNKRTSIVLSAYFMEINFIEAYNIDIFIKESEHLAILIAESYIDREFLKAILLDIIEDGEMSEGTKLRYIGIWDEYSARKIPN